MVERQSYIIYCLCFIVLVFEFVHVRGNMFNNDDLGTIVELSDHMLMRQLMNTLPEASGVTSKILFFLLDSFIRNLIY